MALKPEEVYAILKKQIQSGGGGAPGTPGRGIEKIELTDTQGLVDTYTIVYTDGTTYTYTVTNGQDGFSPTIVENENNDESTYKLDITTKTGTITTPNLKGADGSSSGSSDYSQLSNKPQINNVELDGNKTLDDFGIQPDSDDTLNTTDKTIVGALNELNGKSKILYGGTEIPQNSDMNSYNKFGNYYCRTNANALTLKNAPFTEAFTMTVEAATGDPEKYPSQIYRRLGDGAMAYRYYSNDTSSWLGYVYFSDDETLLAKLIGNNAGGHNSIFRGKNLGTQVTDEQYAAIQAGTFDDLYIGDYWTIGGVNWRIAAFDYYYNTGDTVFAKHHAVIVPDTTLYSHNMNDTNTTTGAYVGSLMYTEGLSQAKTQIQTAFGASHVLSHRLLFTNATSNGYASGGAWVDSTVDLMCENMVYGSLIFSPVSSGTNIPYNYRVEKGQLPLFALAPQYIHTRGVSYWLRDVISSSSFATVNSNGNANDNIASSVHGVRPAFCIGI